MMNTYQLYCGNSVILVGGEQLLPDYKEVTFDLQLVDDCINYSKNGNFQILGEGDFILNLFKSECKFVVSAGGYVLNNLGQSLVILRNGIWDLPKGKLEKNETIEEAAIREVMEETGISTPKIEHHLTKTYHFFRRKEHEDISLKETNWFLMTYNGSEPIKPQTEEGIEIVRWVDDEFIDQILTKTHRNLKILFNYKRENKI